MRWGVILGDEVKRPMSRCQGMFLVENTYDFFHIFLYSMMSGKDTRLFFYNQDLLNYI